MTTDRRTDGTTVIKTSELAVENRKPNLRTSILQQFVSYILYRYSILFQTRRRRSYYYYYHYYTHHPNIIQQPRLRLQLQRRVHGEYIGTYFVSFYNNNIILQIIMNLYIYIREIDAFKKIYIGTTVQE